MGPFCNVRAMYYKDDATSKLCKYTMYELYLYAQQLPLPPTSWRLQQTLHDAS